MHQYVQLVVVAVAVVAVVVVVVAAAAAAAAAATYLQLLLQVESHGCGPVINSDCDHCFQKMFAKLKKWR